MNNYNFMYKVMAQFILPPAVQRIIIMDLDMLVLADLRQLWAHFDRFGPQQMIGMAPEMQPTYYPCGKTDKLMKLWPKSKTGYPAYNGGLQLLDLGLQCLDLVASVLQLVCGVPAAECWHVVLAIRHLG